MRHRNRYSEESKVLFASIYGNVELTREDIEKATGIPVSYHSNLAQRMGVRRPGARARRVLTLPARSYEQFKRARPEPAAPASPAEPDADHIRHLHALGLGPVRIGALTRAPYRRILEILQADV